jgi:hypothetical protein
MSNSSCPTEINVLERLAERIRAALEAAWQDRCNALHRALDIGDALIEAQDRVSCGWKKWLADNVSLSVRTALLYTRLARHRDEVERQIGEIGELSLRAAVRLISKSQPKIQSDSGSADSETDASAIATAIMGWSDADWGEALTELGFERFLQVCPPEWRAKLQRRAGGQAIRQLQAQHPNKRVKRLHLVYDAETSAPSTQH